jgi:transposase-like protein
MHRRRRANFSADQKVVILREHLLGGNPISEVCRRYEIQPSQFYTWQKQLFENGAAAFAKQREPEVSRLERELRALRERLAKKDEVIAELSEEFVAAKKAAGGS